MQFSGHQHVAIEQAQALLEGAGLLLANLESVFLPLRSSSRLSSHSSTPSLSYSYPSPAVISSRYIPPPARWFSPEEIDGKLHRINGKITADEIVRHPPGAIVEYPQTGSTDSKTVAHVFSVDPDDFQDLKANVQYSLGDSHGRRSGVYCSLLRDDSGELVRCHWLTTSCKYLFVIFRADFCISHTHVPDDRPWFKSVFCIRRSVNARCLALLYESRTSSKYSRAVRAVH